MTLESRSLLQNRTGGGIRISLTPARRAPCVVGLVNPHESAINRGAFGRQAGFSACPLSSLLVEEAAGSVWRILHEAFNRASRKYFSGGARLLGHRGVCLAAVTRPRHCQRIHRMIVATHISSKAMGRQH